MNFVVTDEQTIAIAKKINSDDENDIMEYIDRLINDNCN